ncbi:ATP-binding cassette domain-containing protein [Fusibacter tunisiensis]|uniref:ATP-binding cassette subfamily C protein n=1 Tax=Fusibacter tunisiensis TaxID=1008308 RepID=A0ABS2MSD5_9FIRM|nr:ABC transporter ATP-binding protein [Fusibacter tunisiensis]MBM7562309.1 ATP-binding cassette subfamily C protein [Fusibacter tunisiensis]
MLKRIYAMSWHYGKHLILMNLLLLLIYSGEIVIPLIFSDFIDAITGWNPEITDTSFIGRSIIRIGFLAILIIVAKYIYGLVSTYVSGKVKNDMINALDEKIENAPLAELKKYNPAALNNRLFNDAITCIQFALDNLLVAIIKLISTGVLFYLIYKVSYLLIFAVVVALVANIIGIIITNKQVYRKGYAVRDQTNMYHAKHYDRLSTIRETKVNSWYDSSGIEMNTTFKDLLDKEIAMAKVLATIENIGVLTHNLSLMLVILIGGNLVLNDGITIGQLILVTTYTHMCIGNSDYFLKLGQGYQHALLCYKRLKEFYAMECEPNGSEGIDHIVSVDAIDLGFQYVEGAPLFEGKTFSFNKGKIYCIKGENGQGKTTLIDILIGINSRFNGNLFFNACDIRCLNMRSIRREKISVVLQEPILQRMSVKKNLTRGISEYELNELHALCQAFHIEDSVAHDDVDHLSGGEKQKVALIRGLLKESEVLILDEPVSALDSEGVETLKEELLKRKHKMITLIISHNETLFDIVDEFIVLKS